MIGNQKYNLNEEYNEMKTSLVSNILHDLLAWNWIKQNTLHKVTKITFINSNSLLQ